MEPHLSRPITFLLNFVMLTVSKIILLTVNVNITKFSKHAKMFAQLVDAFSSTPRLSH